MKNITTLSMLLATTVLTITPLTVFAGTQETVELDTVVVTADGARENGVKGPLIAQENTVGKVDAPIMETPRSISVVTEQRMEDTGVMKVQDALLYTSGVYAGAYGNDTRGDWYIIRGSEAIEYQDGLKSLFGYYNNARPNAYSISRVEVLKGPASVEYGQGTVGGIVNLVSKLPQEETLREVTLEYGSFNHKRAGVDFAGKANKDGTLLYRFVGTLQDSDHQTDHVEDNRLSLSPSLTWKPNQDTKFTALLNIEKNESGSGTQFLPHQGTVRPAPNGPIPVDIFLSEPGWDRYDTERFAFTLMGDHRIDDVWSVGGAARIMDSASEYYTMYPNFPPTINPDGRTINRSIYVKEADALSFTSDVHVKAAFSTGMVSHKTRIGLDMQDVTLDESSYFSNNGGAIDLYNPVYGNIPTGITLNDRPATHTQQGGIYLTDHMYLGDHWILSLGVRGDRATSKTNGGSGQDDTAFTKNAGLMYTFDNGIAPYVSYAESFNPVIGRNNSGNTFDPIEAVQYEAGIKYQPLGTDSIYTVAVFDITEENRLTSDPLNPLDSVQSGQVGIQGLELEAQTGWRDFDIVANYTLTDSEIEKSNDGDEGFNVADVPDQMASAWVTYRPSSFWQGFKVGGGVRHVGRSWDGADTLQRPSYTLGDAMIGYEFSDKTDITFNVHNITDEKYLTSCLARGDCFLGERRVALLSVTKRF